MDALRRETGFRGSRDAELKSTALLSPRNLSTTLEFFEPGGRLEGHVKFTVTDKWYFAASKTIDLVIEEAAYKAGVRLHADGAAVRMARTLFSDGPRALTADMWARLMRGFVSFMRSVQRRGSKTTREELLVLIDETRLQSRRRNVEQILQLLWESREELRDYEQRDANALANLDPIIPAIHTTTSAWNSELNRPLRVIHDKQSALTEASVSMIVGISNHPHPEFPFHVPLVGIDQVDSRDDPRVQVADLVAGLGRMAATTSLEGPLGDTLAEVVRPALITNSLWGDEASWQHLTGWNRLDHP